jgi:hypothetical protein
VAAVVSKLLWYPGLKAAVFALLACNTAYYLLGGAWTKALDALAWLTLLALFALETGFDGAFGALKPRPTAVPNAVAVGRGFIAPSRMIASVVRRFRTRPRDTLAERPVAGTGAKARCPQTAGFASSESARRAVAAIRGLRLAAAAAVGAAAIGYAYQNEWLDAVNTALWIAVVVLLESEVRSPGAIARHRAWFTATAATLYAGLGALVLVWAWRGEWFDAYDAALWLAAFAMIEMDVLRVSRREVAVY